MKIKIKSCQRIGKSQSRKNSLLFVITGLIFLIHFCLHVNKKTPRVLILFVQDCPMSKNRLSKRLLFGQIPGIWRFRLSKRLLMSIVPEFRGWVTLKRLLMSQITTMLGWVTSKRPASFWMGDIKTTFDVNNPPNRGMGDIKTPRVLILFVLNRIRFCQRRLKILLPIMLLISMSLHRRSKTRKQIEFKICSQWARGCQRMVTMERNNAYKCAWVIQQYYK